MRHAYVRLGRAREQAGNIYTSVPATTAEQKQLYCDIQMVLRALRWYEGTINGDQLATYKAVREFQTEHGLSADGIIGWRTWNVIEDLFKKIDSE